MYQGQYKVAEEKRMKTLECMDAGFNNAQTKNKRKMKKTQRQAYVKTRLVLLNTVKISIVKK